MDVYVGLVNFNSELLAREAKVEWTCAYDRGVYFVGLMALGSSTVVVEVGYMYLIGNGVDFSVRLNHVV